MPLAMLQRLLLVALLGWCLVDGALNLISFAVDPADRDRIVATTEEGLAQSADGGRTWTQIEGPQLSLLSWDEKSGLWGADRNGVVHRLPRTDEGWTRSGALPGAPEALLAQDGALYAAASSPDGVTGIYRSSDGKSWKLLYRDGGALRRFPTPTARRGVAGVRRRPCHARGHFAVHQHRWRRP